MAVIKRTGLQMSQMHFPDPKRLFLKSSANENTFKNMKEQSGDRLEYIQELYFQY